VRRLEGLPPAASWSDVVEADMDFHSALVEAVGSPRLGRVYRSLQSEIRLCMVQLRPAYDEPSTVAAEHRELIEAIAAGPKRAVARVMNEHLDRALRDLTGSVS
jgi:DNA-binding GntR family transcriptional regulator